jgi:hypothetical protein
MIILNDVSRKDAGFESDNNQAVLVSPDIKQHKSLPGERKKIDGMPVVIEELPLMSKTSLAFEIVSRVAMLF